MMERADPLPRSKIDKGELPDQNRKHHGRIHRVPPRHDKDHVEIIETPYHTKDKQHGNDGPEIGKSDIEKSPDRRGAINCGSFVLLEGNALQSRKKHHHRKRIELPYPGQHHTQQCGAGVPQPGRSHINHSR